jgi:crotonobetainyl-CoA:carnitine CoA-transferase CaiB-like acyl-CoA transferase
MTAALTHAALLQGVRILDMATVLAAPFSATLCGDLGAEVVKLELPGGGDPLRSLAPSPDGVPLYWKVANRGKQGITLDVRKPDGRALFLRLLPQFDVLVENFRPGTLDRWGLDIDTLRQANPQLIVLRLTGFGQSGPYASKPGFARVFEAMSGFTHLCGEDGGQPMHMNYPIGDVIAGLFGAFAIAAGVARMRGDPASAPPEIDLSATEALMRLLDPLAVEYERVGETRGPAGNRATYTAPSNMYRSRDGVWLSLVASSDATFDRLAAAIGAGDLVLDARFATLRARITHRVALDEVLTGWFEARDCATIVEALDRQQVPYSRVNSIADVLADPHVAARGAIVRLADRTLGSLPAPCVVPRLMGAGAQQDAPAMRTGPDVGEHNDEVFAGIGVDAAELARLRQAGVI